MSPWSIYHWNVTLKCHIEMTCSDFYLYSSLNFYQLFAYWNPKKKDLLTHWGQVMHICVSKIIIIDSYNGLSPGQCKAIIWTNARLLLIGPLGINFSEILIQINIYSLKKTFVLSILSQPQWVKVSARIWPAEIMVTHRASVPMNMHGINQVCPNYSEPAQERHYWNLLSWNT